MVKILWIRLSMTMAKSHVILLSPYSPFKFFLFVRTSFFYKEEEIIRNFFIVAGVSRPNVICYSCGGQVSYLVVEEQDDRNTKKR